MESLMPYNHLILCRPLLLLPSIFPRIRVFSDELGLRIRWPKYCSFSSNISPSNEYSALISQDWLVWSPCSPRASQESSPIPQYQSINSLALSFLYGPTITSYMPTGKTIALTKWTFADKVMFLLFNMLSRSVIDFLPRSKCLLISWLQSPSAVILEPQKIKSVTVSAASPSNKHELLGPDAMVLGFWTLAFPPSLTVTKRLHSSSSLSALRAVPSAYLRLLVFPDDLHFLRSWLQLVLPPAQRFSWCTLHRS